MTDSLLQPRPCVPIAYSEHFVLPLPPGHRFPMAKYAELPRRLLGAGLVK